MNDTSGQHSLRWAGGLLAATAIATSVAGCGSSGNDAASWAAPSDAASSRPSPSTTASECGSTVVAGSTTLTLRSGGVVRTVIVHVPTGYHYGRRTPMVVNLHGSGTTAALQEKLSGMDATADRDGFLVAYPQGLILQKIGPLSGYDWNVPGDLLYGSKPVPANAPKDAAFVTGLPALLARFYCIDPSRVYLTGFSNGGRLTSYLACNAARIYAVAAPIAGLRLPTPCPAGRPVPVISFQGTADPIDPIAGHNQQYWTYSVPQAAQRWAKQDGCQPTPRTSSGPGYLTTTYQNCSRNSSVQLYTITDEGHEWPGGPTLPAPFTAALGPQSDAVDADDLMWTFFSQHPMP